MSVVDTSLTTAHVVGGADEVPPGQGRAFAAGDTSVAVFRLRDVSLRADGQTDSAVVVCPLHLTAWRGDDRTSTTGAAPVTVYPVREEDGRLVVEV